MGMGWRRSAHHNGGGNYDEPSFPNRWTPQGKSYLDLFFYFFPMVWLKTVLLVKINEAVLAGGDTRQRIPSPSVSCSNFSEFIC